MLFSRAPFEYTRLWGPREHRMPHTLSYHKNTWRELVWMRPMMIVHLAYIYIYSFLSCYTYRPPCSVTPNRTGPSLVIGLCRRQTTQWNHTFIFGWGLQGVTPFLECSPNHNRTKPCYRAAPKGQGHTRDQQPQYRNEASVRARP